MDETTALAVIKDYVARYGVMKACKAIADRIAAEPNTVYGWYRRGSIPQWRLVTFNALKPRKKRTA